MTPAEAARKEFPDPDPLDYGKNDKGATLYRNACIATELRREGYLKRMEQEGWISVEEPPNVRVGEVLVRGNGYGITNGRVLTAVGWYQHSMKQWSSDKRMDVTHWMPLPAPPVPAALTPDPNG